MSFYRKILISITITISLLLATCMAKKSGKKLKGILRQKETNAVAFLRLVVMRLIYGLATRLGFGENISEALNGAFVPPGVDDYDDYGGFGLSDREDDYEY